MLKVYVFGNDRVEEDSIPIRILPKLRERFPELEFVEFDPTEDFPNEKKMIILDTVMGIDNVVVFGDLDKVELEKRFSLHDFDLGMQLKIMKKMDEGFEVKIIGVPAEMNEEEAMKEVESIIHEQIARMILG